MAAKNIDVIRIDMGSPDMPPAGFIIENLVHAARQPNAHGYSPNGGTQSFKQAIASYYRRRFEVDLDPQKETLGLIGSKEGLFNLSQVLLNPGDLALVPDPAYPVYAAAAKIAGAEVYPMPLRIKRFSATSSRFPKGWPKEPSCCGSIIPIIPPGP